MPQLVQNCVRQGWEKQIREAIQAYGSEEMDKEWLDAPLTDDDEWVWQGETS
jgi:hypothetical protein